MNLNKLLRALAGRSDEDYEKWHQVGRLTVSEKLTRRNLESKSSAQRRELDLIVKKAKAIEAQVEVDKAEWWNTLTKEHGLPEGRNMHLTEDGRILMEPEDGQKGDACLVCDGKSKECPCDCHKESL